MIAVFYIIGLGLMIRAGRTEAVRLRIFNKFGRGGNSWALTGVAISAAGRIGLTGVLKVAISGCDLVSGYRRFANLGSSSVWVEWI